MNGKHPIDDLFARGLRDAEAQPPPTVWEGIVRERDQRGAGKRRSRWGLAALLLLLLGAAGYWTLIHQKEPSSSEKEHAAVTPPSGGEESAVGTANVETSVIAEPGQARTEQGQVQQASGASPLGDQGRSRQADNSSGAGGANAEEPTPGATEARTDQRSKTQLSNATVGVTPSKSKRTIKPKPEENPSVARAADPGTDANMATRTGDVPPSGMEKPKSADVSGAAAEEKPGASLEASSEQPTRVSPDVHLASLTGLVTPFVNNTAVAPGPLLQGDSTPAYVLKKGQYWFALQGEMSLVNGSWKGTGREVSELNASETWRGGQGLSLVVGREWLSGWSVGLGIGATKQRSRFLRREVEPAHAETVIDTTWTITPMGTQTNYTWDIVETLVSEPGVERDYSATNSYTRLRIAPEVSRDLLRKKRLTLTARLAPVMMFDIGRTGNTIVPSSTMDSLETVTTSTGTLQLNDASLDERFPMTFAISAGLELRYRFCERWSAGLLPAFTYWMPRAEGRVPSLSMNELGCGVRLRYDFRHQERRVK